MIYDVKNLSFKYPGSERQVLDGASLQLSKGEILCILGPNGSGKTTLLNCMSGLLKYDGGEILLDGEDISKMNERKVAEKIALVPQIHTPSFDYRAFDFVMMGRANKIGYFSKPSAEDEAVVARVMEEMNLSHLSEKSYLDISGGERQQLLIARAIVQEPEVVLFDEPCAYLDFGNQHKVLARIKEMAGAGFSIIITTHNPDHAFMLGDKAAIVDGSGKIIQGKCDEMLTEEVLSEIYGIDVSLKYIEEVGRTVCLTEGL